ncbi:hypothetical protein SELSPUOL_00745 [Selenomonas sputigena ATCC 35185]|uniref:Uncharacterized protein n=1 Tax=Selenomonas sputigena (strain ATCC 35185 / DSM 20758 / CCUG 44933 / VPI D19B-28) TaxID=546271 RepID=C9LTG2_SELS3|nr:hypothetical protein SELSPUOL_00745 [Selenomonas sputigena ATCC 35185]
MWIYTKKEALYQQRPLKLFSQFYHEAPRGQDAGADRLARLL